MATALLRNRSGSLGNHLEAISPSYLPGGKFWYMSYGLGVLTEYIGQQVAGGKNRRPRGRWDRQRKGVPKGMVGGRECKGSLGPKFVLSHPHPATLQDSRTHRSSWALDGWEALAVGSQQGDRNQVGGRQGRQGIHLAGQMAAHSPQEVEGQGTGGCGPHREAGQWDWTWPLKG